mmetsp:Transcript_3936/g.9150  ORF Transcript_3936/g.9150 Transcript_3936/m.9150 type:complete len:199 (+) Transcript_3936:59-655(+)
MEDAAQLQKLGYSEIIDKLVHWESPVLSGGVLVCIDAVFGIFYFFKDVSAARLVCNAIFLIIATGGALKYLLPERVSSLSQFELIPSSKVEAFAERLALILKGAAEHVQQVIFWKNQGTTVRALGFLFAARFLSLWVGVPLALFLFLNLVFIVPLVIKRNQKMIDQMVGPLLKRAQTEVEQLIAKVPKFTEDMANKAK